MKTIRFLILWRNLLIEKLDIVEKPTNREANFCRINHDYLAIAGLLVCRSTIFDFIEKTELGIND
jgi:UTP-glucose-1-phosphate uridylyltransferase